MAPGRTAFLFTALALLTVALFTADLLVCLLYTSDAADD